MNAQTPSTAALPWDADVAACKRWLWPHLGAMAAGWGSLIVRIHFDTTGIVDQALMGNLVIAAAIALVTYLVCLFKAHRVQQKLKDEGYAESGGVQIFIVGLILNPFVLGAAHVAGVLSSARKASKRWPKRIYV